MTDEELTAITARKQHAVTLHNDAVVSGVSDSFNRFCGANYLDDVISLLAEVEAWREVGRAVADGRLYYSDQPQGWLCALCDDWTHDEWGKHDYSSESESDRAKRVMRHEADCPVTKARALLDHGATSTD